MSTTSDTEPDLAPLGPADPFGQITVPEPPAPAGASQGSVGSPIGRSGATVADGSRRRRTALFVVVAAVVAGLIGGAIGHRIQSPADRAAARQAPEPSLITVPVERRMLASELVLAGSVADNEPTLVQLAGGVGIEPTEASVVTDIRQTGDPVQEGDVLLEVTGRPVIVLQGDLPMYRRLVIGSEGPDVAQLEAALVRLGYLPGSVDTVFDADTAAALELLYSNAGYTAEGPSVDEREALTGAQEAVRRTEDDLRSAQQAVAAAEQPMRESERLQFERSLQVARDAVPAAEAAAQETQRSGDQQVATATAGLATARVARDTAVAVRDAAQAGALDPDTGEPYRADRIGQLQVEAARADEALLAADAALADAQVQREQANAAAQQAIADARFQLTLTEAQYQEATTPGDSDALEQAMIDAAAALDDARVNLAALQAATGLRVAPGEIVFVPVLPSTLTESYVGLGSPVQGAIGTLATSSTLVTARVSRVDSALVAVGAAVSIDIRGSGVTTTGTVLSVGPAPVQSDQGFDGGTSGDSSGRLVVTVLPDDPDLVGPYVFWDARVVVSVAATDGDVLVVPVAALTVGPDEVSQVEIERTPASGDEPAVTEIVEVEVGLTSGGLAEVRPIVAGALAEGDRVVVGVETNVRLNEDDAVRPAAGDGADPSEGESTGGEPGEQSEATTDGDSAIATSPIAELLGYDFDPVESRRQQLEVEETVADCMRDEGFEYQPVDYSAQSNPEDELLYTDPAQFGAQYGYGVMRNYELYETGAADAGSDFVDPNQDYVNSLSPEEQNAYYETLYGAHTDAADATVAAAAPSPDELGCYGVANAAVFGDRPGDDPQVQEALGDYYASIEHDPRLDDAYRSWAECVAPALDERGVTDRVERPEDMYNIVNRAKYEAQGLEIVPVSSQAEVDEYFNSGEEVATAEFSDDGSGFVYLGRPEQLPAEEIDRLTAFEVELWQADDACQDTARIGDVYRELEQQVVDQLLARFPSLGE